MTLQTLAYSVEVQGAASALLHFLWQGCVIAALLRLALAFVPRAQAPCATPSPVSRSCSWRSARRSPFGFCSVSGCPRSQPRPRPNSSWRKVRIWRSDCWGFGASAAA